MNPESTRTLDTLLEQAEKERDAALAALQRAEDGSRRAQLQAEQLAGYRQDSLQRWGAHEGQTGSAGMLLQLHGFMQRLDQASAQQRHQCERSAQQAAQARQALMTKEVRVAAVRKLIGRRLQAAAVQDRRRAQKLTDESAGRQAWAASLQAGQDLGRGTSRF